MKQSSGTSVRVAAAAIIAVVLAACTLQPATVKDARLMVAPGEATGYVVGSVGVVSKGRGRSGAARNALGVRSIATGAAFELAYTINNLYEYSPKDIKDDRKKLAVFRVALPPGEYEIYRVLFFENDGYSSARYQNEKNFSLSFTIEAGREVYIGEALAASIPGKNLFGMTIPVGYRFDFTDQRERDFPVIQARFPDFAPDKARTFVPARAIILDPPDLVVIPIEAPGSTVPAPQQ
jgi:hypothetical protein